MEEIHTWRGSPEQRAQRFLRRNSGQFTYFDKLLDFPDWTGRTVLDFGGNIGDLLQGSNGRILQENYYCIDVLEQAIEVGRKRFPRAGWFHYNRYNCSFNPRGLAEVPLPDLGVKFHMILAYSVFTHTTLEDMHELVEQLFQRLAPGGTLAFTFIDPHFQPWPETDFGSNLQWRLERIVEEGAEIDVVALLEQSHGAQWCTLVNNSTLYVNSNGSWPDDPEGCLPYNVYHTAEFMRREFLKATIHPPVNGEMQHCCLLGTGTE